MEMKRLVPARLVQNENFLNWLSKDRFLDCCSQLDQRGLWESIQGELLRDPISLADGLLGTTFVVIRPVVDTFEDIAIKVLFRPNMLKPFVIAACHVLANALKNVLHEE